MTISVNTPPGTQVVCIDDGNICAKYPSKRGNIPSPLVLNEVYTVAGWTLSISDKPMVHLVEVGSYNGFGYSRKRFRRIVLAGLDALLEEKNHIKLPKEVKEPKKVTKKVPEKVE
jgi:hypothetical protein